MVASTIHSGAGSKQLIGDDTELQRLLTSFPALFGLNEDDEGSIPGESDADEANV